MNLPNTQIEYALKEILLGNLVAIPTETVYGLAADARNPKALAKIYAVKGRPKHNPLIIHLPSLDAITDWAVEIPDPALQLAQAFWPGPLTLILKRHPEVSNMVTANQDTVALRVPNHPLTLQLLKEFQGGLAAPSANRSGKISPTNAEHVKADLGNDLDYIVDGGPCQVGIESTILSFVHDTPQILRHGSITQSQIERVLGKSLLSLQHPGIFQKTDLKETDIFHPGQSSAHYAPEKPLILLDSDDFMAKAHNLMTMIAAGDSATRQFAVLSFLQKPNDFEGYWISAASDPKTYAQMLYHHLRLLDQAACHTILVENPPNIECYLGVRDRLQRASIRSNSVLF
jgi:L-threonylcarbamoyladenylate synthase